MARTSAHPAAPPPAVPTPSPLPRWMRPYVPGEVLEDWRERRCASPRCGAVFRRHKGESAESWANKRFCCHACFNHGVPLIPAPKEP